MMNNFLKIAITAALTSGKKLSEQSHFQVNSDKGKDIKLQADLDSEKLIFDILKQGNIDILSEEAGFFKSNGNSDYLWILDPLDGSLNYYRDVPLNCISIALWKGDNPILGVIYDFNHNNLYSGIVGSGAFLNKTPISVSNTTDKSKAIIATGFPVYSSFDDDSLISFITEIQNYKKVRLFGSAAFSLAQLSKGSVDAYHENNIALWDVAAGIALVLAAGGKAKFNFTNRDKNLMNVKVTNGCLND